MHHHFLDRYARNDSVIHRLDARTKLIAALAFTALLVSVPRHEIGPLVPMVLVPFAWITLSGLPWSFVGKQILICSPFVLTLVVFNPLFDRSTHLVFLGGRPMAVPGGILVAANLLVKYLLGLATLVALAGTTRFDHLLLAMRKFRVPKILVLQLYFLYRYLFELIGQGHEILRARRAREVGRLTLRRRVQSSTGMVGVLFIRSYESALKTFQAMESRLYDGELRTARRLAFTGADAAALALVAAFLIFCYTGSR
jgi:cobalt/nickel transport system permease protein